MLQRGVTDPATGLMTKKEIVAALNDTCVILDERKARFELMIHILEKEDAANEDEQEGNEEEEAEDAGSEEEEEADEAENDNQEDKEASRSSSDAE